MKFTIRTPEQRAIYALEQLVAHCKAGEPIIPFEALKDRLKLALDLAKRAVGKTDGEEAGE